MVLSGVPSRRARRTRATPAAAVSVVLAAAGALLASGCGGGTRQDANEPKSNFRLDVVHASFAHVQSIARPATLLLAVHNSGTRTAPNVAVTIDSFEYVSKFPELAANKRPIWIIDAGPGDIHHAAQSAVVSPAGGGQTAYVNTWALGPLAPGATRTFRWRVAPVKSGVHTVSYTVAAGLSGNARAVSATGGPVHGAFAVYISRCPPADAGEPEHRRGRARHLPAGSSHSPAPTPPAGQSRGPPLKPVAPRPTGRQSVLGPLSKDPTADFARR